MAISVRVASFLFFSAYVSALDSDIVITEIAASEKSDHEWIEVYNTGSTSVDVTGWKFFENGTNHSLSAYRGDLIIEAGEYAVIADVAANTVADYSSFSGTLIDSSWETLNESGEAIALKNKNGEVIEQFTYISAPDHSLERKDSLLRDYSSTNWVEHVSGNTIGTQNSVTASQQQSNQGQTSPPPNASPSTPPTDQENSSASSTQKQIQSPQQQNASEIPWKPVRGDVVINEFVSDPADEEKEWIEIYNTTNKSIPLDGWTIEDGSKTETHLSGTLGISGLARFFVCESPKGSLNNAGDRVVLFNQNHEIIDDVSYGNYNDGNISNNASRAYDPDSVARTGDGQNTYNNSSDFKITTTPTKGASNIITSETASTTEDKKIVSIKDIQITEVLPNPAISEGQEEFVELFNAGKVDIDLAGWFLVSEIGQRYVFSQKDFSSTLIKPDSYVMVVRKKSNIALKNTGGDSVKLYQVGTEKASAIFTYHEKSPIGMSAVKDSDGFVIWTKTPTPGAKNVFAKENRAPEISAIFPSKGVIGENMIFDASDTIDAERDPLAFQWDFGDGQKADGDFVSHIFLKAGDYAVTLHVHDTVRESVEVRHIKIMRKEQMAEQKMEQGGERQISPVNKKISPGDMKVDQVYPNPAGRDNKEFIMLKNISTTPLDISGWNIKTEKSNAFFTFPSASKVEPQKNISLLQTQSGLRLQNTSDAVYLFNTEGELIDSVDYEDAPENRILVRAKDGIWRWMKSSDAEDGNSGKTVKKSVKSGNQKKISDKTVMYRGASQENASETAIDGIRALEIGSSVRFRAVVSVEPGILGKMIFYVAGSGIQIYNSRKDFPELRVGDAVEIWGILQESGGETRVRVAGNDAIRIISHGDVPIPDAVETSAMDEAVEGHLVHIQGEVIEVRWPYIYVDDGGGEVRVYVKKSTNIEKRKLYVGDELSVTGIVSQTAAGYRILPRYESDIVLIKNPEKEKTHEEETIPDRSKETKTIFQYLVAIGVTATLISTGLFIQYKMKG